MSLTPGTRLGPYEILATLGAGGMGEVYKARDTRLDRTVAVKVLPEHVATNPDLRQRFEHEAKTLAALSHPHICPVFDVGQQEGVDFLVMECLEGETLAMRLEKGNLPLNQALQYAIQIADALDKAHRKGIVHRDLKPGNVMLTKGGVKLLDFGLAKTQPAGVVTGMSVAATMTSPLTAQGTILGTLHYMAPEQVEGKEADTRSDIFSFGVILYEMTTGKRAFEGKSAASVMAAILEREPPAISSLQPLTPPLLDRIVLRCLAKDPDERWQTTADLMRDLTWIADGAAAQKVATTAPHARRSERVAWIIVTLLLAMIAALAVPATLYVRRPTSEPVVTRLDIVTPPTSDPFSFALSPDGRQVALVANGEKGSQLWLRALDQVTAQPLAGTAGASYPFWAPDSRAIGFFADGKLKRIELTGAAVSQVVADAPQGRGGTWNNDGIIVFAPTATSTGLMRVMATGGTPVPVTRLAAGQGSHRWPQFLPDGRRVLFFVGLGQSQTNGVYVTSLDGGEPTRVLTGETAAVYAPPGYLLRVSQGVLIAHRFDAARAVVAGDPIPVAQRVGTDDGTFRSAFSVSAAGVLSHRAATGAPRQLIWVDRTGKTLGTIGSPDANTLSNPALAPDGQSVAVIRFLQGNQDVWLMDLGRGVASRFTFGVNDNHALWSPIGSQVVFSSTRNGVFDLFQKPANGATDEQPLLVNSQDKAPLDWSPDGRVLLYATQDPKTASDLWALPLTGERKPFPVVQTSFDDIQGQFSPDGRWLAYASNESGRYEIYVRPFPQAGGKWQVSSAGGAQPRWRHDGTELYYAAPDNRLMEVPIRLASDGRAVNAGVPVALFPMQLATGANVLASSFGSRAQYAVASDGRFLMNVAVEGATAAPITVVLNWQEELKQRVPTR